LAAGTPDSGAGAGNFEKRLTVILELAKRPSF
jgi:hypothetical protein